MSTLSSLNAGGEVGWVGEIQTINDRLFPVAITQTVPYRFSNGSWSALSYVGTAAGAPTVDNTYYDAVQYYHPVTDEFELAFVGSFSSVAYTFRPDNAPIYSVLTNAPGAVYVATFDNRLVFANSVRAGSPQRVSWSDRGNPELYAAPNGGFEELLDASGVITRLIGTEDRLLVFFNNEVWQGFKAAFPFNLQFIPMDRTIGTSAPWTVAKTPKGVVFLGGDNNLYIIPKGGAPVLFGGPVSRFLRDNLTAPDAANGVYVPYLDSYMLTFSTSTVGRKVQGVIVPMDDQQTWNPIGFDMPATWTLKRLGQTSAATNGTGRANTRILVGDGPFGGPGGGVLDFTSTATSDLGNAIDCRALLPIGNPNPRERLYVSQARLDYRAVSNSSISMRLSGDWGTTYPQDTGIAMPTAPLSTQTVIGTQINGIYPCVELRHASGHTFAIQGLSVMVESLGNG